MLALSFNSILTAQDYKRDTDTGEGDRAKVQRKKKKKDKIPWNERKKKRVENEENVESKQELWERCMKEQRKGKYQI